MITMEEYLMRRQFEYAEEFHDSNVRAHAEILLQQVNGFLSVLNLSAAVRSGWRPKEINRRVGGSKGSYHIVGRAVDLSDNSGALKAVIQNHSAELRLFNLWMEDPRRTPTWVHLDNGKREDREIRIFKP